MTHEAQRAIKTILDTCIRISDERDNPQGEGGNTRYTQALLAAIHIIDLYMPGQSNNRDNARDTTDAKLLIQKGEPWKIYLSDGGYTRIHIDPFEQKPLWLAGSNGGHYDWTGIASKWAEIYYLLD